MKVLVASLATVASAGITWSQENCGTDADHAIPDMDTLVLEPPEPVLGQPLKITVTADVDKVLTELTAVTTLEGLPFPGETNDGCVAQEKDLPLGLGHISVPAIGCPIQVGKLTSAQTITLSEKFPAVKATQKTVVTDQDGEEVSCSIVHFQVTKDETLASLAEEVNAANNGWEAQVPDKFESLEDVKAYLGAFLPGDAEYQEEPEEPLATTVEAPASFDAIEQWPQCTVISNVRDQSACGSCWAFGSVSSFESRACISTGKDIKYSPEDTAFCSNAGNGCSGGNSAWGYFKSTGVVTGGDYTDRGTGNSCYPYSLAPCAHHVPATSKYPACPSGEYPSPRCSRSCSESGYSKSFSADKVRASSSKSIRGESAMIQELVQNGPIYVSFTVYGDFPTYKSGVYKHTSGSYLGGHAVTLVGYGELNGEKYWKIKNSWNEQWGNNGHFLIARGNSECGIESGGGAGLVSASTVV